MLPYESATEINKLKYKFLDYQLLEQNEIPEDVWVSALTIDGETRQYRIDIIWAYLCASTSADGLLRFKTLAKVA